MKDMKLPIKLFTVLAAVLLLASCKEDNPGVILTKPTVNFTDTTYMAPAAETPQPKNTLLEDFTGVRCTNCPKGHRAIEDMQHNTPGRIIAMSVHGFDFPNFTTPMDSTKDIDMRVTYGGLILNMVGKPLGLPFGTIDRKDKSPTAGAWEGFALNRIAQTTPVNLYIESDYDNNNRVLNVKLKAVFTDTMGDRPLFSAAIYENGLIAPQKDEALANDPVKHGVEPEYVHNHVLRDMPAFNKQLLPPASVIALPEKNRVVEKAFSITLKNDWKPENCYIVFYVHRNLEVLQVVEKKIK